MVVVVKVFESGRVATSLSQNMKYDSLLPQSDIKNCKAQIESLHSHYASRMDALKETVASKTAVPTSQVYVSKCFGDSGLPCITYCSILSDL